MDPDNPSIDSIFLAAVERPAAERAAYLDQVCGGDAKLRARIERLLKAQPKVGSFLESPAPELGATVAEPITEQPGMQIGAYKLLQQLGEGGMGVVYMAEQKQPVKRRVALKIIKPGMDTRHVIARFEAERQALAMMDHPNISKVLDAGSTDSGRPFFVMELVNGISITQYCDDQHLNPRERLELFIPVCQAVQHAHHKGIIHRDLKPSNVLIALYDGEAVPKVIDFGVAKATQQTLTEKTLFTRLGQIVGTWEYMSPEQAQRNQLDVDTRSDIYSLGALLYELLTGTTPFDKRRLRSAAIDELLRIIREEEPPRPSIRLSSIDTLPSVSANRRVEPKKLSMLLRGELDWIVMKAIEKDRGRRYKTADSFAADVQHYLDHEPVDACPPSAPYRLRKFARRNRALLATTSLVVIALLLGLIGTTWQAIRATRALDVAETAEAAAQREAANATREAKRANDTSVMLGRQLRESTALRLASQASLARDDFPVQATLLAIEAVEATREQDGTVLPQARQILMNSTAGLAGLPLPGDLWSMEPNIMNLFRSGTSPDGRWVVTVAEGGIALLWDLHSPNPASASWELDLNVDERYRTHFSANGRWLVTGDRKGARLWDLSAPDPSSSPRELQANVYNAFTSFSPGGRWLMTTPSALPDGIQPQPGIRLWDLHAADIQPPVVLSIDSGPMSISPDDRWFVALLRDKSRVWVGDLHTADPVAASFTLPRTTTVIIDDRPYDYEYESIHFSSDSRLLRVSASTGNVPARTEGKPPTTASQAHVWELPSVPTSSPASLRDFGSFSWAKTSDDGRWLATVDADNTVRLWDLSKKALDDTSQILVRQTDEGIGDFIFSGKSRWLVINNGDNTVQLWNLATEDPNTSSHLLRGHHYTALSPNGRWLVTASDDKTARLWDLAAADPTSSEIVLRGHNDNVYSANFSSDERWLVTTSRDNTALMWDVSSNTPNPEPTIVHSGRGEISLVQMSPNSRWLLVIHNEDRASLEIVNRTARLWDLMLVGKTYQPMELPFEEAAITADGRWVIAINDGTTRLWSLEGQDSLYRPVLRAPKGAITSLAFSAEGRWLVTGGGGTTGRYPLPSITFAEALLWDLDAESPASSPTTLPGHAGQIRSVAISPNGRWIVTGSNDKTARLWDLTAADIPASSIILRGHEDTIETVAIGPNSRWLATGSNDSTIRLWDLAGQDSSASSLVLRPNQGWVLDVAISPNGRWLATGTSSRSGVVNIPPDSHDVRRSQPALAQLWDLSAENPSKTPTLLLGYGGQVSDVAFSPDGRWLATGSADHTTRLYDVTGSQTTLRPIDRTGDAPIGIMWVAFTADSRWLAATSNSRGLLWDVHTANPAESVVGLEGHSGFIRALAVTPDGRWLFTGSRDGTVRMWDLNAKAPQSSPVVLEGHEQGVQALAVTADGHRLAVADGLGVVRLWDIDVDVCIGRARQLAGRELTPEERERYILGSPSSSLGSY